jgi:phosphoglycerate kinase
MTQFLTLDDVDVTYKTVLVRADLNLPMKDGQVTDLTRITRLIPTITRLKNHQAKIILLSHFGRPKGKPSDSESLKQLLPALSKAFGQPVLFAKDCVGLEAQNAARTLQPGQILLLENLRFHEGEEKNDPNFALELGSLGDIYVNDAFSCSHRAHASVVGIAEILPSYAGMGMQAELEALKRVLENPKRPLMAIVAGSKVSTKLDLLKNLIHKVDYLVVGGGMANTFLSSVGHPIGQSLCEQDMVETATQIMAQAKSSNCKVVLPRDVAVTTDMKASTPRHVVPVSHVQELDKILDIGEETVHLIQALLSACATVVWNGPMGVFEIPPYDVGSTGVAKAIAQLTRKGTLISVAGGGDTLAALAHARCEQDFTYTSTAGGAFLEWLEGKSLPGLQALEAVK